MATRPEKADVVFLHHSTGNCVWKGGVPEWFEKHNAANGTDYRIKELAFPKKEPYGWANYPYDYWNIWVNHAGDEPYKGEPTLEILTRSHDVIVFKHCFPVAGIKPDTGEPDVASPEKRGENYRLQYAALKEKLRQFPDTQFIIWTGAALVEGVTDQESGARARAFFDWVKADWDEPGDNIFLWDFYELETEGGLYLKDQYASGPKDPHPNAEFSRRVAPLFCRRIVAVIEGEGDSSSLTGEDG